MVLEPALPEPAIVMPEKRITLDNGRLLQTAALVYRPNSSDSGTDSCRHEILLITSRGSGRWIIPKGWPIKGQTLAQAALREAYEEAGIRGMVDEQDIGSYHYRKKDMPAFENNHFHVVVFAVLYQRQKKKWPEQGQRILAWLSPWEAAARVEEEELKHILTHFTPPPCHNRT